MIEGEEEEEVELGFEEFPWIKPRKDKSTVMRVPSEFAEVAHLNVAVKGYRKVTAYLEDLAKEQRPTIEELKKELKKRGLIRDEKEPPLI